MTTFFISDLHLGHENIIPFCRQQFLTLDDMHQRIIDQWNSVVRPSDIVWVLGDVSLGGGHQIHLMDQMNGTKNLVMGNHDNYRVDYRRHFNRICGVFEYKGCILSHVPVHPMQKYRFRANIHGHLHELNVMMDGVRLATEGPEVWEDVIVPDPWYINVSCEQLNYTPISFDTIRSRLHETRD